MKLSFFTFLFLIYQVALCQDKPETIRWITEKIDIYKNPIESKMEIRDDYIYRISSSELRVKIKNIRKIAIKKSSYNSVDYSTLELIFDAGKLEYKDASELEFKTSKNKSDNKLSLTLLPSFLNDGLKDRMEKALVHLVKLFGGNAIIYKEPF